MEENNKRSWWSSWPALLAIAAVARVATHPAPTTEKLSHIGIQASHQAVAVDSVTHAHPNPGEVLAHREMPLPVQDATGEPFSRASEAAADSGRAEKQAALHTVIADAQSSIVDDLIVYRDSLTQATAYDIVRKDLARTATDLAGEKSSNIEFEMLSGKLKVNSGFMMGGLKVIGGEVNVYKVSAVIAGSVATCKGLDASGFRDCVSTAIAKVGQTVFELPALKENG